MTAYLKSNCSILMTFSQVKQCVTLAINRDGSSGGCCRVAVVTEAGVERRVFLNDELPYFGETGQLPSLKT